MGFLARCAKSSKFLLLGKTMIGTVMINRTKSLTTSGAPNKTKQLHWFVECMGRYCRFLCLGSTIHILCRSIVLNSEPPRAPNDRTSFLVGIFGRGARFSVCCRGRLRVGLPSVPGPWCRCLGFHAPTLTYIYFYL